MAPEEGLKQKDTSRCKEIQAMIPDFLAGTLRDRETERFLEHTGSCRDCYHQLETEFMVDRTVAYLNEDLPYDTAFDLQPLLTKELEEKSTFLKVKRRIGRVRTVILIFTLILIALFMLDLTGLFHITLFLPA